MNDFAAVGRRLRRYRALSFFLFAIAAIIFAGDAANYFDHSSPRAWVTDPQSGVFHSIPLSPSDPQYQDILRQYWSVFVFGAFWAGGFASLGLLAYAVSRKPPTKAVLLLAQSKNGLLSLPEVSTSLDIDPRLAAAALRELQKLKIATPRWQEFRKNLWEFPDYIQLPLEQALQIAESSGGGGGRVTLKDLLARGHSLEIAQQTLDTISEKGLAQQDPASTSRALILEPQ